MSKEYKREFRYFIINDEYLIKTPKDAYGWTTSTVYHSYDTFYNEGEIDTKFIYEVEKVLVLSAKFDGSIVIDMQAQIDYLQIIESIQYALAISYKIFDGSEYLCGDSFNEWEEKLNNANIKEITHKQYKTITKTNPYKIK